LHVERVIKPALDNGHIVICDRFTDSTRAYQGYGHGLDLNIIETLKDTVIGGLEPDVTFILDIDPKIGLGRSERRLASEALDIKQKEDRFESLNISFHEKLRQGFLQIAQQNKSRCFVMDASQSLNDVTQEVLKTALAKIE